MIDYAQINLDHFLERQHVLQWILQEILNTELNGWAEMDGSSRVLEMNSAENTASTYREAAFSINMQMDGTRHGACLHHG